MLLQILNLALDGEALALKEEVHRLGGHLDPQLDLDDQLASVTSEAFAQLWLVHCLRPHLS